MSNIIKLTIENKQDLVKIYIQQFKCGGLFVRGKFNYRLDDEIFLIINLPENGDPLAVGGRVNWLSPPSAVAYPVGIGVQFSSDKAGVEAKNRIEIMLGGLLDYQTNSYTF